MPLPLLFQHAWSIRVCCSPSVVDTGGAYGWNICSRWSRNTNPMCYLVAGDYSLTASLELCPCR